MAEHEHHHTHGENCGCGHDHSEHRHDENGNCIPEDRPGSIHVESHLHDDARVISGRLTVVASYDAVRDELSLKLGHIAKAVQEMGGIVGHIKASCTVTDVEMFSVTDVDVTVKKAPEQEIIINLAAIVFLIEPTVAEGLVARALEAIRDIAV